MSTAWQDRTVLDAAVPGWTFIGLTHSGGSVSIDGINPWEHDWVSLGGTVEVPHPSYPAQRHQLAIYRINSERGAVTFAAGELSNEAWCFYAPS